MEYIHWLIGTYGDEANVWQMAIRAVIIFLTTLAMLKLGNKRFMGRTTVFDFLVGIIIGSLSSRAINGHAPFLPSLVTIFVLIGLHWIFGAIALKSKLFSRFIKGKTVPLIHEGKLDQKEMNKAHVSLNDLKMEMRNDLNEDKVEDIKYAYLERDGKISFIKHSSEPKIIDVEIEEGVKTVRIKLE